jgi:hypothetical protein
MARLAIRQAVWPLASAFAALWYGPRPPPTIPPLACTRRGVTCCLLRGNAKRGSKHGPCGCVSVKRARITPLLRLVARALRIFVLSLDLSTQTRSPLHPTLPSLPLCMLQCATFP